MEDIDRANRLREAEEEQRNNLLLELQAQTPEDGDYCKIRMEIIRKTKEGKTICDFCNIKCPHAKVGFEDYLRKKRI